MNEQHSSRTKADEKAPPIIFVVDDSVELGEMVGMVLADAGYDPRVFSNPLDALQVLESGGPYPSLLISDFRMPGINGLDATRQILSASNRVVVLLVSTYEADEYAPRAAECGASAYIPKAVFGPDRLEAAWAAAKHD